MAPCNKPQAISAIRAMSYIVVVLIPACLPALGCRKEPEPPPDVKSEAVDPETDPIDTMVKIPEDMKEFVPPKKNDSPKKTGTPSGERHEKEK